MSTPLRLVARTPVDLIAFAHVGLGFVPEESLVVSALGGRPFHCRLDVPTPADRTVALAELAQVAQRQATTAVIVFVFSRSERGVRALGHSALAAFEQVGVSVLEVIWADGHRWCLPMHGQHSGQPTAYDLADHPLILDALLAGFPVLSSREALAGRVAADPGLQQEVSGCLQVLSPSEAGGRVRRGQPLPDPTAEAQLAGENPTPIQIARVLRLLESGLPDEWVAAVGQRPAAHLQTWCAMTRAAPEGRVADPAALTALAAWSSGNGALAWCAVERCLAEEPGHLLGGWVARLLETATPPLRDEPA